jgi:[acyl-carrier-protein] S-malonyltransferase
MASDQNPTAILFPGQGVGDESSRGRVAEARPDLLNLATTLVGADPFAAIAEGTRYAQPAVYCASIAGFQLLGRPRGAFFAGHSLGEVGALAAAGAISDEDGLRIVVARGRAMAEAASAQPQGGMLAVGADHGQAAALAEAHGLALANENSPKQFVLSGPLPSIESAERFAKDGGLRAKRLAVAGAFHTAAMEPAVAPFRAALREIDFDSPAAPVLSSTRAEPFPDDPREGLVASLTGSIRWVETLRKLSDLGARRFLDVGPGKVLAGLVRRTLDCAEVETFAARKAAVA